MVAEAAKVPDGFGAGATVRSFKKTRPLALLGA